MSVALAQPSVSQETVDLIRTAMADTTRAGITTATGLQSYQLEAPAKAIVPVITPLVNMLPRKKGKGYPVCHWIAITSFDSARSIGVLDGSALPTEVTYSVAPMQNPYNTIALRNSVTFEAEWTGRALEGDVRARRVGELLYQLKIQEERWIIQGSQFLMVPPRPSLTTAATGGTVAAATYWAQITAINANGETTGSAGGTVTTTGATSTITIKIFTVPFATGYNVYIGSGATLPATSAMWLQSGISGNVNAAQPGFNASVALAGGGAVPSGEVVAPTISVTLTAPPATSGTALSTVAANTAKTFAGSGGALLMFDGLMAQMLNNATTANGLTLGAQVGVPANAAGTLALLDVDNLLAAAYNQAAGDPDVLIMHPQTSAQITSLTVTAGTLQYQVPVMNSEMKGELTVGYRTTHYLNKSTGKAIPIIQDRYCPMDTIIGLPLSVPFPVNDISNAVEIEANQEYWGIDYAITDSSYKFGDYVNETLKLYFLGGAVLLRGIAPSN